MAIYIPILRASKQKRTSAAIASLVITSDQKKNKRPRLNRDSSSSKDLSANLVNHETVEENNNVSEISVSATPTSSREKENLEKVDNTPIVSETVLIEQSPIRVNEINADSESDSTEDEHKNENTIAGILRILF